MQRLFVNKKGMTLIEMLVSLAVLAIVTVPLLMSFTNTIMLAQLTKKQTETNIVTRIVKDNVTEAVKNYVKLTKYGSTDEIQLRGPSGVFEGITSGITDDLKVVGKDGTEYTEYKFTVQDVTAYKIVGTDKVVADTSFPNTYQFLIALKKASGEVIQKIKIEVDIVPEVPA